MRDLKDKSQPWFISKLFFAWTLPILWQGNQKVLTQDEIPNIQENDEVGILVEKLGTIWKNEALCGTPSLKRVLLKMFGKRFLAVLFIVLFQQCVIRLAIPILLGLLIRYVNGEYSNNTGCELAALFIVLVFLSTIIQHRAWFALEHIGMKARIAVTGLIFQKILRLNTTTVCTTGIGQLTNIISNDVNRFDRLRNTPYIITVPIQMLLVCLVLWTYLGPSSIAGICVFVLIVPVQGYLAREVGKLRAIVAGKTDRRIRHLAEVLGGILLIKMNTWEQPYTEKMTKARGKEMKYIKRRNGIIALVYSLVDVAPKASILVTFLIYTLMGRVLSAETVFVTLSMSSIISASASTCFPQAMSGFSEVLVSIRRIQNILLSEEKQEPCTSAISSVSGSPGINVKNLSSKWATESNSPMIINDISFKVKSGEYLGIVGAVGSGKSSLLLSVLGEMCSVSGTVELNGKVAYAPQDPWIFTGSICENILFGLPYDPLWYAEVIEACAMGRDLSRFQHGDRTLVGDRGLNLSGGQKARISLARAIYSKADIYLLDDPLSAVDTKVAVTLMEKCIYGILRDKCVVLVTHQTQFLRNASEIISLQNGSISTRGKYQDLFNDKELENQKGNAQELSEMSIDQLIEAVDAEDDGMSKSTDVYQTGSLETPVAEPEEIQQLGRVECSTYSYYLRSGNSWLNLSFMATVLVVAQLAMSGSDVWLRKWTDAETKKFANASIVYTYRNDSKIDQYPQPEDMETDFLKYLIVYAGMIGGILCTSLLKTMKIFCAFASSSVQMHRKLFESVIRAPMRFFELNSTGRIMNRFSSDVGIMDEVLPQSFYIMLSAALVCAGSVGVIMYLSLPLVLPTFVLLLTLFLLMKLYVKPSSTIKRLESTARSPIFGHVSTSLCGLPVIRAYGVESQFYNQFKSSQNIHTRNFYMYLTSCRWLQFTVELVTNFHLTTVLLYMLYFSTSATAFGLAIASVLTFSAVVAAGMTQAAEVLNNFVSVERIVEYSNLVSEEPSLISIPRLAEDWPSKGEIQMSNVQVLFNGQRALNNISLTVRPGEKIGIVGRTGAGKSTLISTLFRIVELDAGEIRIDKKNISSIGLHDLRQKVSIIPQTPILFSGTIRRNLDPFSRHNDANIWAALQSVQLTERLASHSNVLSEILSIAVSEGGSNFSQGERQLICLARTILEKNRIVILDEATASMDKETDAIIQETLWQEFSSSTLLIVAHRLDTVIETDRILFLDNGLIKEFDEPRRLLENQDSFLYKLVQSTGESNSQRLIEIALKTRKPLGISANLHSNL